MLWSAHLNSLDYKKPRGCSQSVNSHGAKHFAHGTRRRLCRLGSTSGGAGSPNGLPEGVSKVEWGKPTILHSLCRGRQFGDPKLTELSRSLNGIV